MPEYVQLGRRHNDIALLAIKAKVLLIRANTAWIDAVDLEIIPSGVNDYAPGMVLTKRYWKNLYLMIERKDWDVDDYLAYARKRFKELGIIRP